jgi:hypothetical protein
LFRCFRLLPSTVSVIVLHFLLFWSVFSLPFEFLQHVPWYVCSVHMSQMTRGLLSTYQIYRVHTRRYGNMGSGDLPLSHHQLHMAGNIAVLRISFDQHWLAWPPCLTRWCVHCSRVCAPSIAASSLAASQGLFTFPRSFFESSPSPGPNNSAWPVPLT